MPSQSETPAKVAEHAFKGCLLGAAAGDALGLPYEGMSPARGGRMFPDRGRHHFLFGKGMVSDDTEHACFVAQALVESRGECEAFEERLARSLRWWLVGLPAGVGWATLRSILKLWLGFPPRSSGVFSAGNGPAIRSPVIGLALGQSRERLCRYVRISTRITHTDPKAYQGALAVALAAYWSGMRAAMDSERFLADLSALLIDEVAEELLDLLSLAADSANHGEPVKDFARSIGSQRGISGYIYHTVPCVLQVWFRYPDDYSTAVQEIISAGGDTDTTAAILGAIIGAKVGKEGIPAAWLGNIIEWPRSIRWMERLAAALAETAAGQGAATRSPGYFLPGIVIRNAGFLLIVLFHGLRRLGPPYQPGINHSRINH